MTRTLLAALGLAVATSGCSLCFVTPAAPPTRRDCTTSRVAPVVDSVVGAYQVARTVHAVSAPDETYERLGVPRALDMGVGAGLTALFVGSAMYGYLKTAECERYEAVLRDDSFP